MKLTQYVLHILEAPHGRGAAAEQGAIQLGGVANPATAPSNCVQGHRGKVATQRAQLLDRRPSVFPACTSQPQGRFARIRSATRHQDIEVFAQANRIEIAECLGQLAVGTSAGSSKSVVQETHDDRRHLGLGCFLVEERSAHVEVAPLARQSGQRTQALERAPHTTPRRSLYSHGQGHAQPARGYPDLVNRLFLTGLGAWQIGEQSLRMLTHESRRGLVTLLARRLHSPASLEQDLPAHKNVDAVRV